MYKIDSVGDTVVVAIALTRIDAASATTLHQTLSKELEGKAKVLFDLGKVEFMDSTGVGALVGITKRLGPKTRIAMTGINPAVKTIFTLLRIDVLFALHPTRQAALAALQGA